MAQDDWQQRLAWILAAKKRYDTLISVISSLYEEVDKLAKKQPTDPVTQLYVTKVNKAIRAVKELLNNEDDSFVDDMEEDLTILVPAGDLPERQDVLLILGQAKAALHRFAARYRSEWESNHAPY